MMISEKDKETYAEQGFLILRQAFTQTRIAALLEGIERLIDKGLAGECEIGWIDRKRRLPSRTGHLLNPDKYHPAFADWIDADLAPLSRSLGLRPGGAPQPVRHARQRRRESPTPRIGTATSANRATRKKPRTCAGHEGTFVQFNAPLVAGDRFLNIVPGSHLRASTAAEIEASRSESGDMPNAHIVELEPGDIAYYNANLWHRGWNPEGHKRWTMHCAFWNAGTTVMTHEYGQRETADPAGTSGANAPHYAAVHPKLPRQLSRGRPALHVRSVVIHSLKVFGEE